MKFIKSNIIKVLIIIGVMHSFLINAQNLNVSGKVVDSKTGEVLIGVNILPEGMKTGVITNVYGEFNISVNNGVKNLICSYIGYNKQLVKISTSYLTIQLKEENRSLNEVVVVGYGTQKKATITGAVDNIDSERLNMSFNSNLQNQLSGKLAGVRVIQKTGEPGKFNTDINIRGLGTPLIIIDGVVSTLDVFNRLAPTEVDNISVLKDASAAVYGMKAGNGVLLVTTKKGANSNGKPQIDYQGNMGFSKLVNLNEPMNAYDFAIMQNEIKKYALNPLAPMFTDDQLNSIKNTKGLDVYNEVMRAYNPIENHTVSVSGSSGDKHTVKYFLFGNYTKEFGLLKSGDLSYNRYNLRSNISADLNYGISVDLNLSYVNDYKLEPYNNSNQIWKSLWSQKPVDDNGNVLTSMYANADGEHYLKVGQTGYNPLAFSRINDVGYMNTGTENLRGQLGLNWSAPFLKGFKAKYLYTFEKYNYNYKEFRKSIIFYTNEMVPTTYNSPSTIKREDKSYFKNNMQYSLNYETVVGKVNNIKLLALFEHSSVTNPGNMSATRNLTMDVLDELSAGSTEEQQIGSSYPSINSNQGVVGRLNYDFAGKYLFEANFRYDGSSQFAKGKRWGFFPSLSGGWRLSEEKFIKENKNFDWIDNIKLRGSYGILGDDSGASYDWTEGYSYPSGSYIFNGAIVNGLVNKGIANTNLTWYTSKTGNIGLDWSFWNGLLSGSTDVYQRIRSGLLASRTSSIPSTVGAVMPKENLNSDKTIGWDLIVTHTNKIGGGHYSVTANMNISRTMNLHIESARPVNSYENWRNNQNNRWNDMVWIHQNGGQIASEDQAKSITLQQKSSQMAIAGPGDYYGLDLNGDGWVTEWDDLSPTAHNNIPRLTGGLTFSGDYKGFDLSMTLNAAAIYTVVYEEYLRNPQVFNGTVGALQLWTNRWHQDDAGNWIAGKYPRYRAEWAYLPNVWDDERREKDASYIRLKNIEFGYSFPKEWLKKIYTQQLRIYVNAYNLLTFSGIKEMDPEYRGAENGAASVYVYPMNQNFSVGLNVTF